MKDLNKLRQVNPHWEPTPRFTTKEHLNEVHNKLWGEDYYKNEEMNPNKYKGNEKLESSPCANHDSERPKEFSEIYEEIANKVIDDIEDQLFELINEYSEDYDELYWNRYLTDDAPVELLDAAFENYHEHYNEIFKIIMKHFIIK